MHFISLTIKELRSETEEYSSIIFTKPEGFSFELGECFSFRFPGSIDAKVFSFASSPTEKEIIISYKKGVSSFKKQLEELTVYDTMEVAVYGSQFHFDWTKPSIFIAGGIGITAFRSIITYCVDKKISVPLHLLFFNKTEAFPFQSDLDRYEKELSNLKITYISTNNEGRITTEKLRTYLTRIDDEVYIAGPPLMIDATVDLLQVCGVKTPRIHTESFDGYVEEI